MMKDIQISHSSKKIQGEIQLSGSKSISNRVLLIQALCKDKFGIHNLSDSDDTQTMFTLLHAKEDELDAHHAGTTFRFMTAYLATKSGSQILTGSERMKQRPVKALVDALNEIGADITYLENDGYPPLKINAPKSEWKNVISLPANISSQYISALLLIAPTLTDGLRITLEGEIVSRPYIEMTLQLMKEFGIASEWQDNTIIIKHQNYIPTEFYVEADWSAASYYYIIAGLSDECTLTLKGLHQNSTQGDAEIARIADLFGIETVFADHHITINKNSTAKPPTLFEYNFLKVPDIAQSFAVLCAGLGVSGLFSGLQTLRIKETDRIAALQQELSKMDVFLSKMPEKFSKKTGTEYYMLEGKANYNGNLISIDTYNDHRMAMAFAPLSLYFPININDAAVVSKSYPKYWDHLQKLGFEVTNI